VSDSVAELQSLLGNRYVVERAIGHGGMATVYLARDSKHDRLVAVKLLRPEIGALLGAGRFLHEIKLTSRLQHPHILPLYDSGEAESRIFYVMPFVEGESLRDRLRREKRMPIDSALAVVREVADALAYAHAHGVVHRDIKPENILLSETHAIVTDFGIARAISKSGGEKWETLTSSGVVVGTPAYMSPEQAAGGMQIDGRSDIYSLGCVLYEMLVGVPPFTGPDGELKLVRRFTERAPSVRESRATVSERIDAAVAKALELDPADRFTTAQEFLGALFGPAAVARSSGGTRAKRSRWLAPSLLIPYSIAIIAVVVAVWLTVAQRSRRGDSEQSAVRVDRRDSDAARRPSEGRTTTAPPVASESAARANEVVPAPSRRADTAARAPATLPRASRAAALAVRRRALEAGARPSDLAPGDASMDSAESLARAGRLRDAMTQLSDATSSWVVAENAARARVAAIEQQRSQMAPPVIAAPPPPVAPVTTPSTPVVPAPAVTENARPAIAAVIAEYGRAIQSRDVAAIRRVYPGLTAAQQRAWEQFFQSVQQIVADLSIASMEQSGSNAEVSVAGTFDYVLRGSERRERRPVFFRATLGREGNAWRLVTVH
jgi:serine/threonine protein kinase